MKDFTLSKYQAYLNALKKKGYQFLTFKEFIPAQEKLTEFCLIRHDVDRKPKNALAMAKLEANLGIKSTYYFRTKKNTLKENIINEIASLGHEIGYHYENLSDTNGDYEKALLDFESNLAELNRIVKIKTISMHGRPLKPFDNRDLWKSNENHNLLNKKYDLLGEVYLDIDYDDIAYIGDTGRNWLSDRNNSRDKVQSKIKVDFNSHQELLAYFNNAPHKKMVFQIHPERWTDNKSEWYIQLSKDKLINQAKKVVKLLKPKK